MSIKYLILITFVIVAVFSSACSVPSGAAVEPINMTVEPINMTVEPAEMTVTPTPLLVAETASAPTPDISRYLEVDFSGGDPEVGLNLAASYKCRSCHALNAYPDYGPRFKESEDLSAIMERGAQRIADPSYEGQAATAQEYIIEAIFIPQAYIVPGEWDYVMPSDVANNMTVEELTHLLAWMASFSPVPETPTVEPTPAE